MGKQRINLFLHPPINAKQENGQGANTVFQNFGYDPRVCTV